MSIVLCVFPLKYGSIIVQVYLYIVDTCTFCTCPISGLLVGMQSIPSEEH